MGSHKIAGWSCVCSLAAKPAESPVLRLLSEFRTTEHVVHLVRQQPGHCLSGCEGAGQARAHPCMPPQSRLTSGKCCRRQCRLLCASYFSLLLETKSVRFRCAITNLVPFLWEESGFLLQFSWSLQNCAIVANKVVWMAAESGNAAMWFCDSGRVGVFIAVCLTPWKLWNYCIATEKLIWNTDYFSLFCSENC